MANTPYIPDWVYLREGLSLNFMSNEVHINTAVQAPTHNSKSKQFQIEERKDLSSMSVQVQEIVLIEDILYCMMSIEGTYIQRKYQNQTTDSSNLNKQ